MNRRIDAQQDNIIAPDVLYRYAKYKLHGSSQYRDIYV